MKKIFLSLLLALTFALPAWAGPIINVNGSPYVVDSIVKDGITYVPVRFVSEKMGAQVGYDAASDTVNIEGAAGNNRALVRPPISGDTAFVSMVNQALDLLQTTDRVHYYLICQNVTGIVLNKDMQGDRQGYVTGYCMPNGVISLTEKFTQDKNLYNPMGVAGVISHEAIHAMQFNYFPNLPTDNKEIEAYNNQSLALMQIGAPAWLVDMINQMNDSYLN